MTNSKNTRKALITSMLALLLCFTMLLGTTFAWFTDSVSSTGNKIQAGTLKVDLIDENKNSVAGGTLDFVTADGRSEILWEPGCTYYLTPVYVENDGNLALKYKVSLNFDEVKGDAELLNVLNWYVLDHKPTSANDTTGAVNLDEFEGTLEAGNVASKPLVIVVHMSEDAGNEYQGLSISNVSITVVATQASAESDSFGNTYDENATYDNTYDENGESDTIVYNVTDLQAALEAGQSIKVGADIDLGTTTITVPKDVTTTLDLNGYTISMVYPETVSATHKMIVNYGNMTIKDSIGTGKISYTYTGADLGTNHAVNTISTEPGSTLTVQSGTIENLTNVTTIAYAIDGLTNGNLGDVTVNIQNGNISSQRQSIRIFANSTTNTGTLNISGGTFTGRVIVQNASANENKAALNISGGTFNPNTYKSDVLSIGGNNGATMAWDSLSITGGTFNGPVYCTFDFADKVSEAYSVTLVDADAKTYTISAK